MRKRIYLLLGSNEGNRLEFLRYAREKLLRALRGANLQCSGIYETAAWGLEEQPAFLNQAISLETGSSPEETLACIRTLEAAAGRQREQRWGQRTLDVDILLFGAIRMKTPELHIPHPELANRRFALQPLAEIAPELLHPVLGKTITELLVACPDPLPVIKLEIQTEVR